MTLDENNDFYYLCSAVKLHFKEKNPDQEQLIGEIVETMRMALGIQEPGGVHACGGGVGMIRGWLDYLRENESKTKLRS